MVVVRKQAFPPGLLAVLLFAVLTGVALYGVLGRVDPAGALSDSPDDLRAYIETAEVRLQEASAINDQDAVRHEAQLLQAAAERLLAAAPDEEERAFAIATKFTSLSVMVQLGEPDSVHAMQTFAAAHVDDPNPEIAMRSAATELGLEISLLNAPRLISEESAGKLASVVNSYLSKPGIVDFDLPQYGLNLIALSEKPQLAADGYRELAKLTVHFNGSPELQEYFQIRFANAAGLMDSIGKPIELEGVLLDGSTFDWSAYRDKTVLAIFVAAGNAQFLNELPQLKRLHDFFREAGFEIVLISLDGDREAVDGFLAERKISWPVLFSDDPAATGMDHPLAVKYGVLLPMSLILIDRQGNVVCFNAMGGKLVRFLEEEYGPLPEEEPAPEEPAAESPNAEAPPDGEAAGEVPPAEGSENAPSDSDAADSAPPVDAVEPSAAEPNDAEPDAAEPNDE